MINNEKNKGTESSNSEERSNLKGSEMSSTSNSLLGQLGYEQEGKTESFQGNWTGNYGRGYTSPSSGNPSDNNFVAQASGTGNGLTSDEDDLLASGQNVDDLGLGNAMGSTSGKEGENGNTAPEEGPAGKRSEESPADTSAEGSIMPDPEDTTDQNEAAAEEENNVDDIVGDEGPGLATAGDVASMTGQTIDGLGLPSDSEVAGWRQDAGTIGQDDDKDVVDNGRDNSINATSGEFTTGKADKEGGWGKYPNSGDLGQVDPGQQNYVEDQDTSNSFRAGDFKTKQEADSEEGSEKYTRQKTTPLNPGSSTNQDQEDADNV